MVLAKDEFKNWWENQARHTLTFGKPCGGDYQVCSKGGRDAIANSP